MRVIIDAHMVGGRETGNETYIVNLLEHLADLPVDYAAAIWNNTRLPASILKTGLEVLQIGPASDWFRLGHALPRACRRWKADLLHVTYTGPFLSRCPYVVSIHDVSFKRFPHFFSPRERLLFNTLVPLTLRRARGVITLSDHARDEVLHFFPFLKDRVFVTQLAAGHIFNPCDPAQARRHIEDSYGIADRFILAVGNIQPRKNLRRLLHAFALIQHILNYKLVIVGQSRWQMTSIYRTILDLGLQERVIFTGYVPAGELVWFYNAAGVFVYPSLYEGFGLPIIEAMACGTPTITSNSSSMPEVAGDAAFQVDPYDVGQIASAIQSVLNSPDLARTLSAKGLERASSFSWHKTAELTIGIYSSLVGDKV